LFSIPFLALFFMWVLQAEGGVGFGSGQWTPYGGFLIGWLDCRSISNPEEMPAATFGFSAQNKLSAVETGSVLPFSRF